MKKITILLFAMVMSLGISAQTDEVIFDGEAASPVQQVFRQGPSWNPFGSNKGISDDGSGTNNVIEVERTTNAGALWQVLPLLDGSGNGVTRNIGDGATFAGLRLRVRTTKNGDATISARLQNGTVRGTDVVVTGGDGTNFGTWQTIIIDMTSITAETSRPELYVDPFDSATSPPAANYLIQFDDIEAITPATLGSPEVQALEKAFLYPNPTTGIVNINETGFKINNIEVYNVIGSRVGNSTDLTGLVNGIYFLKLYTQGGSVTKRIVKK